jgi:acetolactate synthase regulatory subunit
MGSILKVCERRGMVMQMIHGDGVYGGGDRASIEMAI